MLFKLFFVGITLNDEHSEEIAGLVSHINDSLDGKSQLEDIFSEADHSGQGRGDILRALWAQASDRAAFFKDQRKNSKFFVLFGYQTFDCSFGFLIKHREWTEWKQVELGDLSDW